MRTVQAVVTEIEMSCGSATMVSVTTWCRRVWCKRQRDGEAAAASSTLGAQQQKLESVRVQSHA